MSTLHPSSGESVARAASRALAATNTMNATIDGSRKLHTASENADAASFASQVNRTW
jgi:hypothetical protein